MLKAVLRPFDKSDAPLAPVPMLKIYDPDVAIQESPNAQLEHARSPRQRIAVVSTDPVNVHEIGKLADSLDLACDQYSPHDSLPQHPSYVLTCYDIDFCVAGSEERESLVESLTASRLQRPTIVQSYNLTGEEEDTLRRHGFIVVRHITLETLLAALGGAAAATAAA